MSAINENINNPTKFWKLVKSTTVSNLSSKFPDHLKINQSVVKGKEVIADTFNNYFISAGSPIDTFNLGATICNETAGPTHFSTLQLFNFVPITTAQVHKALLKLDTKKKAGIDQIEPYLLKLAADLVAEPIANNIK